ncbi:diguanylate cyclase [bacterium]|nr:diguanylate cyclase [bacterium]
MIKTSKLMSTHHHNIDELLALCILEPGKRSDSIFAYFKARGLEFEHFKKMPTKKARFWELGGDLVLIDAELEGADIIQFLSQCRSVYNSVPVVAFHSGARGTRDTALIRMGAFDAMPKDIDQWNTQVYLDRAIAQAAQAKKLLSLSWTDHLTGLYNQRFLYENLEREIRRKSRTSKDLTVVLLDLDNFKGFNDTYGDLKGDDVLADVANIIQTSIRKGIDSAYRYDGDEFMLILPETDLEQAGQTLDRILEKLMWRIPEKLTFSVGLALLGDCKQASDLVRCADDAMHRAKDAGGDTMVKAVCGGKEQNWLEGTKVI